MPYTDAMPKCLVPVDHRSILRTQLDAFRAHGVVDVVIIRGYLGDPDTAQVFQAWGDDAYYRLAPGGSFDGGPSWSLAGGARVVSGNEPYRLVAGTRSLSLPAGSTATSPAMCFAYGDWHARFVVRNTGASTVKLKL